MRTSICVLLAITITIFASCSKDDKIEQKSSVSLLTGKKWQLTEIISIDSTGKQDDLFSELPEFEKDDYFLFNADSTYELNDNLQLRADSADRIIDAGDWEIIEGNKILMASNVFYTTYHPAEILEINENSLYVQRVFPTDKSTIRTRFRKIAD